MEPSSAAYLTCSITVETLNPSGEVIKRNSARNSTAILGRNEFQDLILKLEMGKIVTKYSLKDNINIRRKFVKDGKACIQFPARRLNIMISNCPPNKLAAFLKSMMVKRVCNQQGKPMAERARLLSELPRKFQEISPLTERDVQTVNNVRAKKVESNGTGTTPAPNKRKGLKRARDTNENMQSEQAPRKKLHVTLKQCNLSSEQKEVLNAVQAGQNIFFTGSAGTGKSFLLKKIVGALPPNSTFATASTGVAACHIGGTTLHQFAGMGDGTAPLAKCIELACRQTRIRQWKACKHLIVDEISMVDGDFFSKLEAVARAVRNSTQPFGGIQLILCGDFLQLPPVTKPGQRRKFCFQSPAWSKCINQNFELRQVRRQNDNLFIGILQNIRIGRCPREVCEKMTSTASHSIDKDGILATRLCTHKEDVEQLNKIQLQKLDGDSVLFEAYDSDPELAKHMNNQCPVGSRIELKIGAQVMLAKNLDIQRGLVNGARGVVKGFEHGNKGYPCVKFICGEEVVIRTERWSVKAGAGITLTRRQLPLKLAWAISIHKSQGMSLDCVEISLSRVFECGQAYVALSRATSLEGLRVIDFDPKCVRAHPDVITFYKELRKAAIYKQRSLQYYVDKENQNQY
ncbi:ATP-dependent DNA helicase PIF1-like [Amphiura filiformis]|uniref:ATP-dependent DNA helicase PIF1-like n=1 Tax=Amphiura filiformis TaxID=82378 RepID=UPI003B20F1F5